MMNSKQRMNEMMILINQMVVEMIINLICLRKMIMMMMNKRLKFMKIYSLNNNKRKFQSKSLKIERLIMK